MNRLHSPRLAYLAALAALGLAPGCGNKSASLALAPVSGKVTVEGQPLTAGQVTLFSDVGMPTTEKSDTQPAVGMSTGQIDSTGAYKIVTNGKTGAPLGKYKVTVTPPMMPVSGSMSAPVTGFDRKYGNPKETPLRIEVVADPAAGKYDLKLTK